MYIFLSIEKKVGNSDYEINLVKQKLITNVVEYLKKE